MKIGISRWFLFAIVRALSACSKQDMAPEWTPAHGHWTPIMRRLSRTQASLKKPPSQRIDLIDGASAGLVLRVGPRGATWSMRIRVVGEDGTTIANIRRKAASSG
jgi:hypothetical protein